MDDWEGLGAVAPERLADARLQLHWAAQAASAPGRLLLPPQPDYSQQSLGWRPGPRVLAQGAVAGERPFRPALRLAPPALLLLGAGAEDADAVLAELPLAGSTLEQAYAWLTSRIEERLGHPLAQPLERPGEMPAHPVGEGRPFADGDPAFAELARYFAAADAALSELAAREPAASPVRCWPHHFDLAVLIPFADPHAPQGPGESGSPGADPESAPSIGAGLSPGDAGRAEPYFYVTPWPYPAAAGISDLPELDGGGAWNREGWVGAVLPAARFVTAASGAARREQVERFLGSAVAACKRLLGAGSLRGER